MFARLSNLAHAHRRPQFPHDRIQSPNPAPKRVRAPQETATRIFACHARVLTDLRAHGEQTYPRECCGALLGKPLRANRDRRLADRSRWCGPPTRAPILPRVRNRSCGAGQDCAEARSRGLEIAGFYHSHPDHPAQWSATDLADAHWLGAAMSSRKSPRAKPPSTHALLLAGTTEEDKRFEAQTVEIATRIGPDADSARNVPPEPPDGKR